MILRRRWDHYKQINQLQTVQQVRVELLQLLSISKNDVVEIINYPAN